MNPRPITEADLKQFPGHRRVTMKAPAGMEDVVAPTDVLMERAEHSVIIMVPFELNELEVAKLAHGATVWCVFAGSMPPMYAEVKETAR